MHAISVAISAEEETQICELSRVKRRKSEQFWQRIDYNEKKKLPKRIEETLQRGWTFS